MTSLPAPDAATPEHPSPGPTLVARTERIPLDLAAELLALLPPAAPESLCSWVRRGEGIVGWGRALSTTVHGDERFAELSEWWRQVCAGAVVRDDVGAPGTGPVAFGSVSYAGESRSGATLVVPEVIVGRRGDRAWVTTLAAGSHLPAGPDVRAFRLPAAPRDVRFSDGALDTAHWGSVVAEAVRRITAGDLDKVVLARDLIADAGEPVDARALLRRLADRYQNTWVFSVDGLVGATPELLVRLERGLVTSRVLAGTIRRTGDDDHDLALAGSLARSSKDLEEHEYAVRSVAEALTPHCSSMNVPESPFVLHLPNVMHLATDVTGVLRDGTTSLHLAASLHPSAAVCGTPTPVADALIAELEGMDRGRYAGPVGWLDARGDGEWGIALRCAAFDSEDASRLRLFAGCGIVAGSDPEAEIAESDAKLVPMRDALSD